MRESTFRAPYAAYRRRKEERLKHDIADKYVAVIFDGTTHVCEAMVVLICFVDDSWNINQRVVVHFMLLAQSLTGEEVAQQLITTSSTDLGIPSDLLLAAMQDRTSVNAAIRTSKIVSQAS